MKEKNRPEEKNILEILDAFENEFEKKSEETKSELEKVKYYENFNINGIDFQNLFITTERDENGKTTRHVYCGDISNEILSVNEDGNVEIKNPKLKRYLDKLDFEKTIKENEKEQERLKGISEKATPKEMKNALKSNKEENDEQDSDAQVVEEDLQEQGQDLGISKYRKIKDNHIDERMPEVFEEGEEHGIAFSNKLNRFVITSKINGHYQVNKNTEPAKMTWRTIISINENGEKVERKIPHALMKLPNNSKKEIAVTLDQYGTPDIETVDVLPCQERIARQVRLDREGIEKEETREIRKEFENQGKYYKHDIAHRVNQIEEAQKEENKTVNYDITEDDYIPGIEPPKTWGQLMEETGDSLPKLIERYDREMAKKDTDSKKAVQTIVDDYETYNRERKQ